MPKRISRVTLPLFLIVATALVSLNKYLTFLATLSTINAIAVLGIVIISGYTGQLNLGQAAFVGLGAYAVAILELRYGLSFWIGIPAAIAVSVFFGILMGIPALKLKGGPYLALVTQTFGEIIYLAIMNLENFTGGPFGLLGISYPKMGGFVFSDYRAYFALCVVFLVICYFVCRRIMDSPWGYVFMGIRESEDAEQSLGINTMYYKIMSFAIAAAFGGISGALYAPFIGYISPDQFRWTPSLLLVSMAIVGGITSLRGGILGAFVLTFLPELLRLTDEFRLIVYGLLVVGMLALLPDGLISIWGRPWGEIKQILRSRVEMLKKKDLSQTK